MKVVFDPAFYETLKRVDVRIKKRLKERVLLFITSDWRAIYKERVYEKEVVAHFVAIGTHRQLYK